MYLILCVRLSFKYGYKMRQFTDIWRGVKESKSLFYSTCNDTFKCPLNNFNSYRGFSSLTRVQYWKKKCSIFRRIISSEVSKMLPVPLRRHGSAVLRLEEYDCIGFDLDNTLCEYNISSCVDMEYNVLANYLVKEKGYDPNYLLKPLDSQSFDFIQKGLLVDFANGNILKIAVNGIILKASHGTKFMTEKEIMDTYGKDKKWAVTNEFCKNMLVAWNGPLAERMRALLDYFDIPACLAFARVIDSLDIKAGKRADVYNVWPDVLAGIHKMYLRDNFRNGEGGYFTQIKSNPHQFIKACNPVVKEWLVKVKESKITFLITGSNCDFASFTAETSLGKDWQSLFDIVICYARKPGFFSGCRPFISLNGFKETDPINGTDLELGKMYNQGNWQELYQLFRSKVGKQEPKCLYFGDNLIQDVYTPSEYTKCDTVAVVEELCVTNIVKAGDNSVHPSESILSSQSWGSYFFDEKEQLSTVWGGLITNYSKLCIPSLSALAQFSTKHQFTTFNNNSEGGYIPFGPTNGEFKKNVNKV